MKTNSKFLKLALPLLLGVLVFLFWDLLHPEVLNYHEQNQLFLFSWDYFLQRISVPGGLADWLSEFCVQFYYYSWAGALVLALLFIALQQLVLLQFNNRSSMLSQMASLLPSVFMIWHMGDIEVLLSYMLAMLLVLAASALMRKCRFWWADIPMVLVLYWLAGPMAWVYAGLKLVRGGWKQLISMGVLLATQVLVYHFLLDQNTLTEVMLGINYYRVPDTWTGMQVMQPVFIVLLPLLFENKVVTKWKDTSIGTAVGLVVCVLGYLAVDTGYDKDICELLTQDMLVRQERWDDVIERAEKHQVQNPMSSNYVNLSLAMKRQLADRMFDFYQSGDDALIMPAIRDNVSNIGTAEAFYHLSMTNSCLRYFSDLQESILNFRKSGRFTKRIAECYIVNGNYPIARKQLALLKQSLFYRSWAEEAEACLGKEALVNANPDWGRMRRFHFKNEFLYSYPEIDKMLGQLFADNIDNKMALDYFMGDMLLKGNPQGFMGYMRWVQQYGGYQMMPAGYQDAINAIQARGELPGSAYANFVKRMMSGGSN